MSGMRQLRQIARTLCGTSLALLLFTGCEGLSPLGSCDPSAFGVALNSDSFEGRDLAIAVADATTRFVPALGAPADRAPLERELGALYSALTANDLSAACEAYNRSIVYFQVLSAPSSQSPGTAMEREVVQLTLGVVESSIRAQVK